MNDFDFLEHLPKMKS